MFLSECHTVLSVSEGQPLGDLSIHGQKDPSTAEISQKEARVAKGVLRGPAEIIFVRNRMLYARAALNAQGGVRFGLRHIRKFNSFLRRLFHLIISRCSQPLSARARQELPRQEQLNTPRS